jgi:hypothetical protein
VLRNASNETGLMRDARGRAQEAWLLVLSFVSIHVGVILCSDKIPHVRGPHSWVPENYRILRA